MIKIDSVHIEEIRGVRTLSIVPGGQNFAIYGPNGAGKSGIVDAIEFGLTGGISRLSGKGTGGMSVKNHGPHVDCRTKPEVSRVRLNVTLPALGKTVEIDRSLASPKNPKLNPHDSQVAGILDEFSRHWELALSRREIIKYVLAESSTRAKEVQALLRLDDVDQVRATLKTASNKIGIRANEAASESQAAASDLRDHLGLNDLSKDGILRETNTRRQTLGLKELTKLDATTRLDEGLETDAHKSGPDKELAMQDVDALLAAMDKGSGNRATKVAQELLTACQALQAFPDFARSLKQKDLIDLGLSMVDSPSCPLCDKSWDLQSLRLHLKHKRETVDSVVAAEDKLLAVASQFGVGVRSLLALLEKVRGIASVTGQAAAASLLRSWTEALHALYGQLETAEEVLSHEKAIAVDWSQEPAEARSMVENLKAFLVGLPHQSTENEAHSFLVRAQERLARYQKSRREGKRRREALEAAKVTLNAYAASVETVLANLYTAIEADLTEYYRFINLEDEAGFAAKLKHSAGKLDLNVDFYGRGFFPPGAYHSEGHQDGMGVCMYLALMNEMFGHNFTLAILDDVVMSVDKHHRREVCRLLLEKFPNTQFIITTHDEAWFRQMQALGLVKREFTLSLRSWSVEGGPVASQSPEIWAEIDSAVESADIPGAAAKLRRHLEYVSRELADSLGAKVVFRADENHDLGDLLPDVVGKWNRILGAGAKAAQKWKDEEEQHRVAALQEKFSQAHKNTRMEEWALNPAVHFNEWANFAKTEFLPVVQSYRNLLSNWQCAKCESWAYVTPKKGAAEVARCKCGKGITLNLREK